MRDRKGFGTSEIDLILNRENRKREEDMTLQAGLVTAAGKRGLDHAAPSHHIPKVYYFIFPSLHSNKKQGGERPKW